MIIDQAASIRELLIDEAVSFSVSLGLCRAGVLLGELSCTILEHLLPILLPSSVRKAKSILLTGRRGVSSVGEERRRVSTCTSVSILRIVSVALIWNAVLASGTGASLTLLAVSI
jgi:hypothetical protein